MDTNALKKFAQQARSQLRKEVSARLQQVLLTDSAEMRQKAPLVSELQERIRQTSQDRVIEAAAYSWFNRLCALRYMDLNGFNRIGVVSPVRGATQPEILQEAKGGHVDDSLPAPRRKELNGYLNGSLPSDNPQQEAYRLLLVAACNRLAEAMPFLFERIEDYTQLLMPLDLLSESSILHAVREALTAEACEDVEVIGWLYQFYISEKKDEVMARKSAVPSEDIPAVTQLFTPHWIVRYMVENSLGRLWMLNHPESKLAARMDYYIAPEGEQTDFLHIDSPEELKLCDPACGSGHILTYAFDLLVAIYEELGYDPAQISALILEKNLFGIEIDGRAGALAAFALYMKAYEKDRRFARRGVLPNICVMEDVSFSAAEIQTYMDRVGSDLFTQDLWFGLKQFEQATTFGSLIRPEIRNPGLVRERMQAAGVFNDLFLNETNRKVQKVLEMVAYLSPRYQVVVANPPYMGGKGMNEDVKDFATDQYPDSKSDLFAMFIERGFDLILPKGCNAMVTMQSWMFLSSYEKLRTRLLDEYAIDCMVHMDNMVMGIAFGTAATIWQKLRNPHSKGQYSYVYYEDINEAGVPYEFPVQNERLAIASAADFKKIPGSPIAYWVSNPIRNSFENPPLSKYFESGGRCKTTNDAIYLRHIWEVAKNTIGLNNRWCLLYKGGSFQKFYGNREHVIKWSEDAKNFYASVGGLTQKQYWEKIGITWTIVSAHNTTGFRLKCIDGQYNSVSPTIFPIGNEIHIFTILGLLNSIVGNSLLGILNPTLALNVGNVLVFPIPENLLFDINSNICRIVEKIILSTQHDWDSYEISLDFTTLPLMNRQSLEGIAGQWQSLDCKLSYAFHLLRTDWQNITTEVQRLEEENNRIFIEAYGLQDELTPEVPLDEITLTCNPHYRYGAKYSEEVLEARLLEDTMKELLSYAVGCMFGRYSLDQPGLVLANQGEMLADYLRQVPQPAFMPDEDNVIPVLEGDWFADDVSERFKTFLRVTFGEAHYDENLAFIEAALGKDIRTYFVRDFYKDHVQTYKKRPIYWLFSSPKGSFNALIYMHRYRPDTISVLLNKYLREYQTKLRARRSYLETIERNPGASNKDKTAAIKEMRQIDAVLVELRDYENEVIYPLAAQQIAIDLDDGVKVNYEKFGTALKGI